MNAKERAEKIAKIVASLLNYEPRLTDSNYAAAIAELNDAFEEAQREAVHKAVIESFGPQYREQYAEGFQAAKEKAKEIAEGWTNSPACKHSTNPCCHYRTANEIAQRISEMVP